MKTKQILAGAATALLALSLCACGGGGKVEEIPFTDLTLECTEDDVVKEYGPYTSTETNDYGGNTYEYDCAYLEKGGKIDFYFDEDGKAQNIAWSYSADSGNDVVALSSKITSQLQSAYGDPYFENEAGTVWRTDNTNVTLIYVSLGSVNRVQYKYIRRDKAKEEAQSGETADAVAEDENASEAAVTAVYKKGETVEGNGYQLVVDSVDATPEYLSYEPADSGYEFFFASFELENTGSEALDCGGFFKVYADGEECKLTKFSDQYNGVDWLDQFNDLEAGRKVKNYISAVVPDKWNEVQIVCSDGSAVSFAHTDLGSISSQTDDAESAVYHMGDTLTRTGMAVTLKSGFQSDYIAESSYSHYEPDAGNYYLVLFFDIRNDSTQTQNFKVYSVFDVYVDDYAKDMTYFFADIDGQKALADQDYTEILSGKSINGYIAVEVPTSWQKVELVTRQGTFEITPDVVETR